MIEDQDYNENYIFFLRLNPELPKFFYKFSRFLSEWGITIVPVSPKELLGMAKGRRKIVVSFTDNLATLKNFLRVRKTYLDFALKSNKLFLIDVTSFEEVRFSYKVKTKGNYQYVKMPVGLRHLAKKVTYHFYSEEDLVKKWPGGKRTKLPTGDM